MALTVKIVSIRSIGPQVYAVSLPPIPGGTAAPDLTVNLRAFSWNGSCDCGTFTGCCEPLLIAGARKRWRCEHINAARQWFMEHELPRMISELENANPIIVLDEYEAHLPAAGL